MKKLFAALALVLSAGSASALTITQSESYTGGQYCYYQCKGGVRFTLDANESWTWVDVTVRTTWWTSDIVMEMPRGVVLTGGKASNGYQLARIDQPDQYNPTPFLYFHGQSNPATSPHRNVPKPDVKFTLHSKESLYELLGGVWKADVFYSGNEYHGWGKAVLDGPEDTHVVIDFLAPVSVPASAALLPFGLGALALVRRKQKKQAA